MLGAPFLLDYGQHRNIMVLANLKHLVAQKQGKTDPEASGTEYILQRHTLSEALLPRRSSSLTPFLYRSGFEIKFYHVAQAGQSSKLTSPVSFPDTTPHLLAAYSTTDSSVGLILC